MYGGSHAPALLPYTPLASDPLIRRIADCDRIRLQLRLLLETCKTSATLSDGSCYIV